MFIIDIYNGVYKALATDKEMLELLSLVPEDIIENVGGIDTIVTPKSTNKQKSDKIQKRHEPQNLSSHIPLIAFYTPGGEFSPSNDNVFTSVFMFDIYTVDDVNKAHQIANRLHEIFDSKFINIENLDSFESLFEDAYESKSSLPNSYCFTMVISVSVGMR
jgi:hypothetical protein